MIRRVRRTKNRALSSGWARRSAAAPPPNRGGRPDPGPSHNRVRARRACRRRRSRTARRATTPAGHAGAARHGGWPVPARRCQRGFEHELGDVGQPVADLHQGQHAGEVHDRNPEDGRLLKVAEGIQPRFRVVGWHSVTAAPRDLRPVRCGEGACSKIRGSSSSSSSSGWVATSRARNSLEAQMPTRRSSAGGFSFSRAK